MLEDLVHQIRSPLVLALARLANVKTAVKVSAPSATRDLDALYSLLKRLHRTIMNIDAFSAGISSRAMRLQETRVSTDELHNVILDLTREYSILVDPSRKIRFSCDLAGLGAGELRIPLDMRRVEQALACLIDNAVKYSYRDTTIHVMAYRTGTEGAFGIAVENEGIELRASDVDQCISKGWRGAGALAVTSEGSGLGLWIANEIMRAHGGRLEIRPTDQRRMTRVDLVFSQT